MSDCTWIGAASDIKQVDTITIAGTWTAADTITLTINGVDFIITIGSLITTTQVALTLYEAFTGSTLTDTTASYSVFGGAGVIPYFRDITMTSPSTAVITLKSTTAGKPYTLTVTESTASTGTATLASVTAATGKNHATNADNWSSAPAHGDRLIFPAGNAVDVLYSLTLAIQPSEIIVQKGFKGKIGLDLFNIDNPSYPYAEYRTRYLTSGSNSASSSCTIGIGDGAGSQRINLDFSTLQYAVTVYGAGARRDGGTPTICLKGSHASNTLAVLGGDVGYCYFPSESGHLASVRNSGSGKTVVGSGVDLGDAIVVCAGGMLEINSLTTTSSSVSCTGGVLTINAGNQLAVACSKSGRINLRNGGTTIATLTIYGGSVVKETASSITFTNPIAMYDKATFLAEDGNIPTTTQFKYTGCEQGDCVVKVGENRTFTLAA